MKSRSINNSTVFIVIITLSITLFSCQTPKPMFSQGISQGISGRVLWFEGDLMPGFDKEPVEGKPIKREIHIYEATTVEDAEVEEGQFYSNLKTNRVHSTVSDEEGKFWAALEPGTYSVFVKEPRGLFANTFDQKGIIHPVTVRPNELVQILIRVDYKAAY